MRRVVLVLMVAAAVRSARADDDGAAGSPSFTSKVSSLVAGVDEATVPAAGSTTFTGWRLRGTLSQAAVTANVAASSTNFSLVGGGISAVESEYQTSAPVVFGILSNAPATLGQLTTFVSAEGNDPIRIVGANFLAPGVGTTFVLFDAAPVPTAVITSNTTIDMVTMVGKDFTGTPLGPVDVSVVNAKGGAVLPSSLVYTPALVEVVPPKVGGVFQFAIAAPVAAQVYLLLGLPSLAVVKIPPLKGALLLQILGAPIGPFPLPAGQTIVPANVPALPALVGITVALQSIQIPLVPGPQGSFSNEIEVTVQ